MSGSRPTSNLIAELPATAQLVLGLSWTPFDDERHVHIDLSLLLLGPGSRVRADTDLVFYNAPNSPCGSATLFGDTRADGQEGGFGQEASLDLSKLPSDYSRVGCVVSIYDTHKIGASLCDLGESSLTITRTDKRSEDPIKLPLLFPLADETARLVCDFTRTLTGWRVSSLFLGTAGGLRRVAASFGVKDDDPQGTWP